MNDFELLAPRPKRVRPGSRRLPFPTALAPRVAAADARLAAAADRLATGAGRPSGPVPGGNPLFGDPSAGGGNGGSPSAGTPATPLEVTVDPGGGLGAGGYRLEIAESGISVRGDDAAGAFWGLQTLGQVFTNARAGGEGLAEVAIEDAPDFARRAVSLDVNRDKVPRMETLFSLVDRLASWKTDQLHLYTEHVFAYAGHEEVWRGWSPFTPDEIRALDAYCRDRFVELVPNQNSLAHFHRWLVHDRYRDLAEVPDGIEHPFSFEREPFSLCPVDERTYDLLADLYDQLLPCFGSRLFHVGLDEPIDLGLGRSRAACEERGTGRVFLGHLLRVREMVLERGHVPMFWADWILLHPELAGELPDDVVACAWGYEADHPFERDLDVLAGAAGRRYVCPGTSSWNSLLGRTSNALANLLRAGRAGRSAGCEGYLVADWGDNGHWQPLPVSYSGLLFGACVAWNADDVPGPGQLAALLDRHVLGDGAGVAGRALLALGDAHRRTGARTVNASAPFLLLRHAHEALPHPRLEGLSVEGLERTLAAIDEGTALLHGARMPGAEGEHVTAELDLAADLASAGCRLGLLRLRAECAPPGGLPKADREALARDLRALAERHRELWPVRNRPGGLDDSVSRIERVARLLRGR